MGTIYTSAEGIEPEEEEGFEFSEALKDQVVGLGLAFKDAVSSMLTLSITSLQVEEEEGEDTLRELIRRDFTPASAMAFMVFILIYTSCLGTYAVMVREIGKLRATLFLGYSFVMAWALGFVVYRVMMVF